MKFSWIKCGLAVLSILQNVSPSLGDSDQVDFGMAAVIEKMEVMGSAIFDQIPPAVIYDVIQKVTTFYLPLYAQSEQCRLHSSMVAQSLYKKDLWAIQMLDASSKLPPGVLKGNIQDLGHFDECLATSAPGGEFSGQFCVVKTKGLSTPELAKMNANVDRKSAPLRNDLMFSLCIPSSCSAQDLQDYLNLAFSAVNGTAIVEERSCTSNTPLSYSMMDKVTIFTIVVLLSCIILSTYYEWFHSKEDQRAVLRSFSLITNVRQLMNLNHPSDSITCINGLRVFAMSWVLIGHRVIHTTTIPKINLVEVANKLDTLIWAPIQRVDVSVDIFIILAGFVVAYCFLIERTKKIPFNYLKFCAKRYFRLTPPMAVMALLYATLLIRTSDGPLWNLLFGSYQEICQKNWLWTLTYISNYVDQLNICIINWWYLSVIFQMHVFSPILLLPLHKSSKLGVLLLVITLFSLMAKVATNFYTRELVEQGFFRRDYRRITEEASDYYQTEHRSAPFIIGLLCGFIAFKVRHQAMVIKISQTQKVLGWLLALFLLLTPIFCVTIFHDPDYVHVLWVDTVYHTLYRPAFSLGISWIIFICIIGQGGVIDKVLSSRQLLPLSRLTYCVYLVHYYIQDVQIYTLRAPIYLDTFSMFYEFFSDFVFSHALAAVLFLAVESPFLNICNYIFKDKKKLTDDVPTNLSSLPSFNTATTKKYPS